MSLLNRLIPPRLISFSGLLCLLLTSLCAWSGVYYGWTPAVSLQEEYNSNVTLSTSNQDERFLSVVSPSLGLTAAGRDLHLDGELRYTARRYSGQGLSSNDWSAQATSRYRQKTQQWSLETGFIQNASLQSELLTSGRVQGNVKRFDRHIAPGWQASLTDMIRSSINYRYNTVDYGDGALDLGLLGYRLQLTNASILFQLSARDLLTISPAFLYYRTRDDNTKSDDRSLSIAWDRNWSRRVQFRLSLGLRQTETSIRRQIPVFFGPFLLRVDEQVVHDRQNAGLFSVSVTRQWQRTSVNFSVERKVSPSGGGGLLQSDQLSLSSRHRLSPALTASLALLTVRSRGVGGLTNVSDYTYYNLSPSINWQIDRDWHFRTYYAYSRQSYANSSTRAQGQQLGVSLSYRPAVASDRLW